MPPAVSEEQSRLLQLPPEILLAVLQCLAAACDQCSLLSAAQAHSRLHKAAVAALSSITVEDITEQQLRVDSMLLYLTQHSQHVSGVSLLGTLDSIIHLQALTTKPQLQRLRVERIRLQLKAGHECQGVLGHAVTASTALTQLQLINCQLVGNGEGLAAALVQLPRLQHLVVAHLWSSSGPQPRLNTTALRQLEQLTHLELSCITLQLEPQQLLHMPTKLRNLRLEGPGEPGKTLPAGLLAGAALLTRLELQRCTIEPGAFAGRSQLQHLSLMCGVSDGAAGRMQVLSLLQGYQQLTHLELSSIIYTRTGEATPPAAAFSALTASSRLQQLVINLGTLPEGVWQHMFPPGRQLPHLTLLELGSISHPSGSYATAPPGSCLVSCCPGLRSLKLGHLSDIAAQLPALRGLSALHSLHLATFPGLAGERFEAVAGLTRIGDLTLQLCGNTDRLSMLPALLHLTALQQLTTLKVEFWQNYTPDVESIELRTQEPGDEPVWRQLLQLPHKLSHGQTAQHAAEAAGPNEPSIAAAPEPLDADAV